MICILFNNIDKIPCYLELQFRYYKISATKQIFQYKHFNHNLINLCLNKI